MQDGLPEGGTDVAADVEAQEFLGEVDFSGSFDGAQATPLRVAPPVHRSALPALVSADSLALGLALICGHLIDLAINGRGTALGSLATLLYVPVFLFVMSCYGLYRRGRRRLVGSSFPDISHLLHSLIVGSLAVLLLSAGLHRWWGLPNIDRTTVTFTGLIALLTVTQGRAIARWVVRRPGKVHSKVLIVGSGVVAASVIARLQKVDGVEVVGCVDDDPHSGGGKWKDVPMLGGLDVIPSLVAERGVDHLVVAFSLVRGAKLAGLLRELASGVQISVVPRLFDLLTIRSHVDDLHGLPVIDVAPATLSMADRFAKRVMDIVASGLILLVTAPVLAIIAIAVKATSPGPILFRQRRTGKNGTTFQIYKFRTMRKGAENEKAQLANQVDGPLFKVYKDPRITRVGAFLRKTSLDELPQLINVLKGDMSLVGPRPFITTESAEIGGWATRRFDVRPGMTGLWQISGRNDLPFEELCRLDYSYVASWSLWWDARILWHTPAMVLHRHGAY
jgi:exopolysaccharide biosynthesis polyprenyl glycosylphosphotransferase